MFLLLAAAAFLLGAIVGSFLNVVIHRYPREESIVFPPSHCPECDAAIRWYDNVPLLSFAVLLGRCRACRQPISWRYPLVELANALFYLAIFLHTGPLMAFVLLAAMVSMLIVLIYIDAEIQILPDVIDIPGTAIGLVAGWLHFGALYPGLQLSKTLFESVTGAIAGAGVLLAISLAYKLIRKIEGMGLGDVKMMAMLGATLGWEPLIPLMLISTISGALAGMLLAIKSGDRMKTALPFGVFLGFGFLIVLFFGSKLTGWYLSLLVP